MRRRDFIMVLGGASVSSPVVYAQRAERIRQIGILTAQAADDPSWLSRFAALKAGLQGLGWEEGKNISFQYRQAVGTSDQIAALAVHLVSARVDAILVGTAALAQYARDASRATPIVSLSAGVLEGTGLIDELRRPGGNVTGIQLLTPELMSKRLSLLQQLVPNLTRVGFLEPITPAGISSPRYFEVTIETARALQIEVHRVTVNSAEEYTSAFANMARHGDQAVIVFANPLSIVPRRQVIDAAALSRLPTIYELRLFVASGGLVSYGADVVQLARDGANYLDKILRGANPAELPVQQPTKFELVINLNTAKSLSLRIPPSLLALADEVIE